MTPTYLQVVSHGVAQQVSKPQLFDVAAWGILPHEVSSINGYLVDAPKVFVVKRTVTLADGLPKATYGNMPRDDGNLIVEPADHDEVASDPVAAKYLRPFMGAAELLHNKQRWCLWLVGASPEEIQSSSILRERTDAVRAFRLDSSAESTRGMASTPHLFGQRPALYSKPYLCIPAHVSENRRYYLAARLDPEVIAGNANFTALDPDGLLFGLISSSMFMAWQSAVGGKLESRLRFSNTVVWNNFPIPDLSSTDRAAIVAAGKQIVEARALEVGKSLADLYDPDNTSAELLSAHCDLDEVVDAEFGLAGPGVTVEARQTALFETYARLDSGLLAGSAKYGRKRRTVT